MTVGSNTHKMYLIDPAESFVSYLQHRLYLDGGVLAIAGSWPPDSCPFPDSEYCTNVPTDPPLNLWSTLAEHIYVHTPSMPHMCMQLPQHNQH